jgi:hypothetical protein
MTSRITKKEADKRDVICALSDKGRSLLFFYEETPGPKLGHERLRDGVFLVRPPYTYEALEKWLNLGNWQAIHPPVTGYNPIDSFRMHPLVVEHHLDANGVIFLIDSFHDKIEWNVVE